MMYRTSIFTLFAAAMTFAAGGADNITVNVSVDSHIGSVTLQSGMQSDHVDRNGSSTWTAWAVGTAYAASASSVDAGYTARWKVTKSGAEALSGGMDDAITLAVSYSGCNLAFFGEPNTYGVTLDRQSGNGGSSSVTATYDAAMPSITNPERTGYAFGGYWDAVNGGGTQYYTASGASARNWDKTSAATLYAKWTANTYAVTFGKNGGSGGSDSVAATYDAAMPSIIVPERTGYTFGGYYTGTDGGGTQYYTASGASTRNWDKTTATTLYAKWTVNTYAVTFEKNGGSGGSDSVTATYDAAMPSISKPERTGYTFDGYWDTLNDGGTQYYTASGASARNWDKTSATTLYAKWTANAYAVKLDRQSGSGGTTNVTAVYGSAMPTPIDLPTRTGYTFGGYYASANGGGAQYYKADGTSAKNWDKTSAATLYAKWTANTYAVTFGKNGGSGGSDSVTATYAAAMPAITKPERTGYTFGGYWDTLNNGTQYYKADGTSAHAWDKTTATKLWAKWTTNTYTVTLDRQSGSGGASSVRAVYNAAMPTPIDRPTRTGYTFGGYYTGKNGGGTQYYTATGASARNWNIASNTTLYAKWTANAYEVAFQPNGADGGETMPNQHFAYDVTQNLDHVEFTYTAHAFRGWSTVSNRPTVFYPDGAAVANLSTTGGVVNLYANWTGNVYKVTFGKNGGSGGTTNVQATYGAAMPTPIDLPTLTGYAFNGYWDTVKPGGTRYYNANGTSAHIWDKAVATMLWAKWETNKYTVTLDRQSGTGGAPSVQATYNAAMPTPIDRPTRTGYTFGGYYTAVNGGGTQYYTATGASARNWNIASNTTLYAKWTTNAYAVKLDTQSGTGGTTNVTAVYGSAMPTLIDLPTRTGYAFNGYYTATNGVGTKYYTEAGASARNWNIASNTTLYAMWTGNVYKVTFGPNGGVGGTTNVLATYGTAMPLITKPERTGYTFDGYWNTVNPGGTQYYDANGKSAHVWDKTAATTLWAKWTANKYKVTFNKGSGSDGDNYVTATYGSPMPTPRTAPKWPGYTFDGYWTGTNGTGTQYYDGSMNSVRSWDKASATTLYAKWTANTYQVTFEKNGGSGGSDGVTATYDAAMPTNGVSMPTRTGYTFAGYYASVDVSSTKYYNADGTSAKKWDKTSATTLWAKWMTNKYLVTFGKNGGSSGNDSVTATYDAAMPAITPPSRKGYTFGGYWDTVNPGGTQYYNANGTSAHIWDKATATTLWAKWTTNTYTVMLDRQSGSGGFSSVTATYAAAMPPITKPERTGYTFGGYWDKVKGGGTQYYTALGASARNWDKTDDLTLYANWAPNTYTVSFHANDNDDGVEGEMAPITCTYDVQTNLPYVSTSTFMRDGWGFKEWTNEVGEVFVDHAPVMNLTATAGDDVKMYACWTGEVYEVVLNANGGVITNEMGVLTNTYVVGDEWLLPTPTNVNMHLPFVRWEYFDVQGGTNADGAVWTRVPSPSKGVTNLVARWGWDTDDLAAAVDAPKLEFDTFCTEDGEKDLYFADWIVQTDMEFVKEGTSSAQSGALPQRGDLADEGVDVYASWLTTTVTNKGVLTFWWKCSAPVPSQKTYAGVQNTLGNSFHFGTYDENNNVFEDLTSSLTGCVEWVQVIYTNRDDRPVTFAWKFQFEVYKDARAVGGGTGWVDRVTWKTSEDENVVQYLVAFDKNGADGNETMADQLFVYDHGQNLSFNAFTYTGHAFAGWSTNSTSSPIYKDHDFVSNLATGGVVNLYAQWTNIIYTVAFDANGGEGTRDPITCTYDVPTNLPPCSFTRDGYGFKGWMTNVNDEVLFADRARVTNLTATAQNVTMYACWTGVTYSVVFDASYELGDGVMTNGVGDLVSVLTNSCVVGDAWNFPAPTNVNAHLSFERWAYVDSQGATNDVPEFVPPPSEGITNLVAVWTENGGIPDDPDVPFDPNNLAAAVDAPELEFDTFYTKDDVQDYSSARWFAQTNFVVYGRSAVQSGALPQRGDLGEEDVDVFASWLTTTVTNKGELTFWWKCSAPAPSQLTYAGGQNTLGNSFHFGKYDENGVFTDLTSSLTGCVEWVQVIYENRDDGPVTFAWQFQFEGYGRAKAVGGGTGWVDRVTWTPDESATGDATTTHVVPYSWLREKFSGYGSASKDELETLAEGDSPNGKPMKVWQEYWAGTDPNDPNDLFRALIAVTNNVPYISWQPDLSVTGDPRRVYHVLCAPTPSAQEWVDWPGPGASGASTNRFFKVELDWEGSKENHD